MNRIMLSFFVLVSFVAAKGHRNQKGSLNYCFKFDWSLMDLEGKKKTRKTGPE